MAPGARDSRAGDDSNGRLYVVATPIGNLGDLSPRAREVLGAVAVVAAEDTRVSGRMLARFEIRAELISYHDANEAARSVKLLERLKAGDDVALISDAGTPCISDPGYRLVKTAADAGVEVITVPGPSAVIALLSVSGLPTDRFSFAGFLPPRSAARRKALRGLGGAGGGEAARTVVVYESPRRILGLLEDVAAELGDPQVAAGRELTKMHEEVLRGRASEVRAELAARDSIKGEFVVAIHIEEEPSEQMDNETLKAAVAAALARGETVRDIAAALKDQGIPRRRIYSIARELDRS